MNYWRVGAVKVATEEGSNLLSSKEVTMATEPQPTSQGILQGSGCLEKGGTVAKGPWDPPFQQIPQAPVPGNPSHPKNNGGVEHQANNRDLKHRRRGRQRERQKTIVLISKTLVLHVHYTLCYISLPSSAKQRREMTKF